MEESKPPVVSSDQESSQTSDKPTPVSPAADRLSVSCCTAGARSPCCWFAGLVGIPIPSSRSASWQPCTRSNTWSGTTSRRIWGNTRLQPGGPSSRSGWPDRWSRSWSTDSRGTATCPHWVSSPAPLRPGTRQE